MTSLAEALKPCPWCGNQLTVTTRHNPLGRCDTPDCWMYERKMSIALDDPTQVAAWNNRNAISSALTAAPPVQEGWRGIETAPRDGTVVLLWSPEGPSLAAWRGRRWVGWCEGEPIVDADSGWCLCPDHPTHWRPLPAAPEPTGVSPTGEMG